MKYTASKLRFKKSQQELDALYNTPMNRNDFHPVTEQVAGLVDSLNDTPLDTLNSTKMATLKHVREAVQYGAVIATQNLIDMPMSLITADIDARVSPEVARENIQLLSKELMHTRSAIVMETRAHHTTNKLRAYSNSLALAKSTLSKYVADCRNEDIGKQIAVAEAAMTSRIVNPQTPFEKFVALRPSMYSSTDAYADACLETFRGVLEEMGEKVKLDKPEPKPVKPEKKSPEEQKKELDKSPKITESGNKPNPAVEKAMKESAVIRANSIFDSIWSKFHIIKDRCEVVREDCCRFYHLEDGKEVATIARVTLNDPKDCPKLRDTMDKAQKKIRDKFSEYNNLSCEYVEESANTFALNIVYEDVVKVAQDAVRSGVHTVRRAARAVSDSNPVDDINRAIEPLDNLVNKTIDDFKAARDEEKKDEALGQTRIKLLNVIGKCIAYGGLAILVHPAVAAIAFLGKLAYDKATVDTERTKIVNDLKRELTICEEKIKDADGKGDNENKYRLMRIKNELERQIVRVDYKTDKY